MHSTNYSRTFICVAPDTPAIAGVIPPERKTPSIAAMTYERLSAKPYHYTSDDLLFGLFADRREIPKKERAAARAAFFSKGQPCLRCSDLSKKYGWGFHFNDAGKIALFGMESRDYAAFVSGKGLPKGTAPVTLRTAMRSSKRAR